MLENFSKRLIPISIIIAGLIIAGTLVYLNQEKIVYLNQEKTEKGEEQILSSQEAAEKAIDYINENKDTLTGGNTASLLNVTEEGSVYKIRLKVGENEFDSYVTKDGKLLFPGGYNLEETQESEIPDEDTSGETQKRDIPDVKLFVVSYCPYGLQAQKMFLPVYNLLKDKAEMGVYFVDYAMHDKEEIDENLRQYCIQREEKEKYADYLNCFLVDGSSDECLSQAGIDEGKIRACASETDKEYKITEMYNDKNNWVGSTCPDSPYCFPPFNVDTDLNAQYGVSGSPTIVINDTIANINPRSPENFKEIICQAFNSPPEECSQTLSNNVPSPGFGGGTSSSSGGSCE